MYLVIFESVVTQGKQWKRIHFADKDKTAQGP